MPRAEIEGDDGRSASRWGLCGPADVPGTRKLIGPSAEPPPRSSSSTRSVLKIGVLFGCFSYNTQVTLADRTTATIGKIVNRNCHSGCAPTTRRPGEIVNRPITGWFDSRVTDHFRRSSPWKSPAAMGAPSSGVTVNHLIRTPGGWREAAELAAGDMVLTSENYATERQAMAASVGWAPAETLTSPTQPPRPPRGAPADGALRKADRVHRLESVDVRQHRPEPDTSTPKAPCSSEPDPLPELSRLRDTMYPGDGEKHLSADYLKSLTPLALAVWFMV